MKPRIRKTTPKKHPECSRFYMYLGTTEEGPRKGKPKVVGGINACKTRYRIPDEYGGSGTRSVELFQVLQANMKTGYQSKGLGTKLYEAAAKEACQRGVPLASSPKYARSPMSTSFWNKQLSKGRADQYAEDGIIYLRESCGADLSEFQLPSRWPWYAAGAAAVALLFSQRERLPPLSVLAARKKFGAILDTAAANFSVPSNLVRAVAWVESRWNPQAGSPVGAVGLLQLMPGTAQTLGVKDRTDPVQNAQGGAKLLASLYKRSRAAGRGWPTALAAYNWGLGNVFGVGKSPSLDSHQWPAATQKYVLDVLDAQKRGVA